MSNAMTPRLEFFHCPLEFVIVVPENTASSSRWIRISFACGRRGHWCSEPCIEGVGWSCDKEEARVVDAQEHRCECLEDIWREMLNSVKDSSTLPGGSTAQVHRHFSADYTLDVHEIFIDYLQSSFPHFDFQTFPSHPDMRSISAFFISGILGWGCGLHCKRKIARRYIKAM